MRTFTRTVGITDREAFPCTINNTLYARALQDHKATDASERSRIEAAGGFVIRKRVMGVLAVARSFGDFVLKKFVTAEPYTSTTKLDAMVRAQYCICHLQLLQ
jgi:serine/threonine protein phosphatase PrpC